MSPSTSDSYRTKPYFLTSLTAGYAPTKNHEIIHIVNITKKQDNKNSVLVFFQFQVCLFWTYQFAALMFLFGETGKRGYSDITIKNVLRGATALFFYRVKLIRTKPSRKRWSKMETSFDHTTGICFIMN